VKAKQLSGHEIHRDNCFLFCILGNPGHLSLLGASAHSYMTFGFLGNKQAKSCSTSSGGSESTELLYKSPPYHLHALYELVVE